MSVIVSRIDIMRSAAWPQADIIGNPYDAVPHESRPKRKKDQRKQLPLSALKHTSGSVLSSNSKTPPPVEDPERSSERRSSRRHDSHRQHRDKYGDKKHYDQAEPRRSQRHRRHEEEKEEKEEPYIYQPEPRREKPNARRGSLGGRQPAAAGGAAPPRRQRRDSLGRIIG